MVSPSVIQLLGVFLKIDWRENDAGSFTAPDALLLKELGEKYNISSELVTKLIEVELSLSGLGKRKGIMNKLESILKQDWDVEDAIDYRNQEFNIGIAWKDKIRSLQDAYDKAPSI